MTDQPQREMTEQEKQNMKFVVTWDQFVRIHKLDVKLAHEIQLGTRVRTIDDSMQAVDHLANIAKQLQQDGTKEFELPFTMYGGKFVWVPDEEASDE